MAIVELSTLLNAPPERVWEEVNRPALLQHVAHPLVAFEPVDPPTFPERWEPQTYRVRMRLFGLIPVGWQVIGIEHPSPTGDTRYLRDNGRGVLVRRWDHLIVVEPAGSNRTRYTDRLEIEAGLLTPLVWMIARMFYAHRQRRWNAWVARSFRYCIYRKRRFDPLRKLPGSGEAEEA